MFNYLAKSLGVLTALTRGAPIPDFVREMIDNAPMPAEVQLENPLRFKECRSDGKIYARFRDKSYIDSFVIVDCNTMYVYGRENICIGYARLDEKTNTLVLTSRLSGITTAASGLVSSYARSSVDVNSVIEFLFCDMSELPRSANTTKITYNKINSAYHCRLTSSEQIVQNVVEKIAKQNLSSDEIKSARDLLANFKESIKEQIDEYDNISKEVLADSGAFIVGSSRAKLRKYLNQNKQALEELNIEIDRLTNDINNIKPRD